jgi:hypothetical protein
MNLEHKAEVADSVFKLIGTRRMQISSAETAENVRVLDLRG